MDRPRAPLTGGAPIPGTAHVRPRTAFGHGKVILFGEHAVVYGHPAVAASLPKGATAIAKQGNGRLSIPAWRLEVQVADGSQVGRALQAILTRLDAGGLDFDLAVDIPSRAGLGSSAAVSAAIARATAQAVGLGDHEARQAAFDAEAVFHGSPSGIDTAVAFEGGVGRFDRGAGWQPIHTRQPITLCVGLSGRPRHTLAQVEKVRRLRDQTAAAASILKTMGELSDEGTIALVAGEIDVLGRLLDVAHGLLVAIGVSAFELDTMVHLARSAGAIGAKMTGAGGGGAVIALAPGSEERVLGIWRKHGYDGFLSTLGEP